MNEINSLTLTESIDFLNAFRGTGYAPGGYPSNIWGNGRGDGNLYDVGGSGAGAGAFFTAYLWLNTSIVNRWQRYLGRYLYMSNGYCKTAINNLVILALGSGLTYQTPNKSKQRQIDEWIKKNKWRRNDIAAFRDYLVQGEVYLRVFGDKVRRVDPDLIYGDSQDINAPIRQGVCFDKDDWEEPTGFMVHERPDCAEAGEFVSAGEMQQRANKHFGQWRGFSWILPVASDLFEADRLTNSLMRTAQVLSKIAFWRVHKASEAGVNAFQSKIQATQPRGVQGANGNGDMPPVGNIEHIPESSIFDLADSVDIKFPEALAGESYNALLDATLRKISASFHLPSGVFNDKSERGAYAAELVSNTYIVRSIEAIQEDWKQFNLELMELCGIDTSDVTVVPPEVSIIDKKMEAEVADFLIRSGMASRQTAGKIFGLDWEEEQALIKSEQPEIVQVQPLDTEDNEQPENDNSDRSNGSDGSQPDGGTSERATERQDRGNEEQEQS